MAVTQYNGRQLGFPIMVNYSPERFEELKASKQVNTNLEPTIDYIYIEQTSKDINFKDEKFQNEIALSADSFKLYEKLEAVGYGKYFKDKINGGGGFFSGINWGQIIATAGVSFLIGYGLSKILK